MKTVTIYEVSQEKRVLACGINEIPFHERSGPLWGNPDGESLFIRYSAPVSRVVELREEDGFVHRQERFVAFSPRLLDLLAGAVREADGKRLANRAADLGRDLALKSSAMERQRAEMERVLQENGRLRFEREATHQLYAITDRRLRNFRDLPLLSRIWRAITRAI